MNKKSFNIFRIIISAIVIVLLLILLQKLLLMNTVYLGDNTRVTVIGSKIIKHNSNNNIKLRKVKIYDIYGKKDGYLKSESDSLYIVSNSNKNVDVDYVLASGSMVNLDVVSYSNMIDEIDTSLLIDLNKILDKELTVDNITDYKEIKYDIDNDSKEEKVLSIVYMENSSIINEVFLIDGDNNIKIVGTENDYEENNYETLSYSLVNLIDFNKDKKFEIVISKCNGDSQPTYYDIYKYEEGKVKEIK